MNIDLIVQELTNDPLTIGYSGMTDSEVADSLNTVNREINVSSVQGSELFEAADPTEVDALTADERQKFYAICSLDAIKVNSTNTRNALLAMFGVGSTTRTNLAALQKTTVSRATELGIGYVKVGHIIMARDLIS